MKVLVSGSSGLIGQLLLERLRQEGHTPLRLVREAVRDPERELPWSPREGWINREVLAGIDAVVNLNGKNIGAWRWTERNRKELHQSRIIPTRLLAGAIAGLRAEGRGPGVLINASGTGWYGDGGDEELTESSSPGEGFLAALVRDWEEAAEPARAAGVRVVCARFGVALVRNGGMLQKLAPIFRLGLGGVLGGGGQWFSWIHGEDLSSAVLFALDNESLAGPVNVTAPQPVRFRELVHECAAVLHRPAWLRVPGWAVELLLGREMARDTVLVSQRVLPVKLQRAGFRFAHPELRGALGDLFGRG